MKHSPDENNLKVVGGKDQSQDFAVCARSYSWIDPAQIARREFLYGSHLIRGFVSVTVSPGGLGKSSLVIAEAIAMTIGKPLLDGSEQLPLKVWYWNLEDPYEELQRRFQATCHFYGLSPSDVSQKVFVDSGRDSQLCITNDDKGINWTVVNAVIEEITQKRIDVLIIDPFVSSHSLSENDNTAQDLIVKAWGLIAHKANCAVHLVHHTRKSGNTGRYDRNENTAESARGGGALIDGARSVRVLNRPTTAQAKEYGVSERSCFYCHIDKANLAGDTSGRIWFRIRNVELTNGDSVGVVERWFPEVLGIQISNDDRKKLQNSVAGKRFKKSPQAANWVGYEIAKVLGIDPSEKANLKKIQKVVTDDNTIIELSIRDKNKGRDTTVIDTGDLIS